MRPIRIAHVSDVHFTHGGVHEPETFEAGLQRVNAERPDVVVVSGDLTDWGLRPEFDLARRHLDRFDAPVLTCLGNHDARREGWRIYCERFRERYYHERVGDADFVVLDSSQPDTDEGEVGREQRGWLVERLRGCRFPSWSCTTTRCPCPTPGAR